MATEIGSNNGRIATKNSAQNYITLIALLVGTLVLLAFHETIYDKLLEFSQIILGQQIEDLNALRADVQRGVLYAVALTAASLGIVAGGVLRIGSGDDETVVGARNLWRDGAFVVLLVALVGFSTEYLPRDRLETSTFILVAASTILLGLFYGWWAGFQKMRVIEQAPDELKKQLTAKEAALDETSATLAGTESELRTVRSDLKVVKAELEDLINSLPPEIDPRLVEELEAAKAQLEERRVELEKTIATLATTEEDLRANEDELKGMRGTLAATEEKLDENIAELEDVRGALAAKEEEFDGKTIELKEARGTLATTEEELKEVRVELEECRRPRWRGLYLYDVEDRDSEYNRVKIVNTGNTPQPIGGYEMKDAYDNTHTFPMEYEDLRPGEEETLNIRKEFDLGGDEPLTLLNSETDERSEIRWKSAEIHSDS